jgi:hypothetical protein
MKENTHGELELPDNYADEACSTIRKDIKTGCTDAWKVTMYQEFGSQTSQKESVVTDSLEVALAIKDEWILKEVQVEQREGYLLDEPEDLYGAFAKGYEQSPRVAEVLLRDECRTTVRLEKIRYIFRTREVTVPIFSQNSLRPTDATMSVPVMEEHLSLGTEFRAPNLHTEEELPSPPDNGESVEFDALPPEVAELLKEG